MRGGIFEGFKALFTGGMNERLEFVIRDGEVVEESPKWKIFTIRRNGRDYRVAFQKIEEITGKTAPDLAEACEVVEEMAALVATNEPLKPEPVPRGRRSS